MGNVVRWLLVPVAGVAAGYAAILTVATFDWIFWKFDYPCEKERLISASCPGVDFLWYTKYLDVLVLMDAGLIAIAVVVGCTWAAPKHKQWVAIAAYGIGAVVACRMGILLGQYTPMASALGAGALAVIVLRWRQAVRMPANNSLQADRER